MPPQHTKYATNLKKKMFFLQTIFSTIFATIIFFMTEQPIEIERYLKFTLVYILTTILADGIGLTLGSLLDPVVSIACDD